MAIEEFMYGIGLRISIYSGSHCRQQSSMTNDCFCTINSTKLDRDKFCAQDRKHIEHM